MKFWSVVLVALLGLVSSTEGFVLAPTQAFVRPVVGRATMSLSALPASQVVTALHSSVLAVSATVEPGTVNAPGWVLPLGAVLVILTAGAIPLLLKPGDDAAREMQDRDSDLWGK
ncbi:unnamed protein product [Choristocarpus tenellus]